VIIKDIPKMSTVSWFHFYEGGIISPQNEIGNAILKNIMSRVSIFRGPHKSKTTDMWTLWVHRERFVQDEDKVDIGHQPEREDSKTQRHKEVDQPPEE
jgi:hypothetical protein